jgi:hypothetical protein
MVSCQVSYINYTSSEWISCWKGLRNFRSAFPVVTWFFRILESWPNILGAWWSILTQVTDQEFNDVSTLTLIRIKTIFYENIVCAYFFDVCIFIFM